MIDDCNIDLRYRSKVLISAGDQLLLLLIQTSRGEVEEKKLLEVKLAFIPPEASDQSYYYSDVISSIYIPAKAIAFVTVYVLRRLSMDGV